MNAGSLIASDETNAPQIQDDEDNWSHTNLQPNRNRDQVQVTRDRPRTNSILETLNRRSYQRESDCDVRRYSSE